MKLLNNFFISLSLLCALPVFAESVPLKINAIYLPHHGFDDNDDVELVIDTHLPNICYLALAPLIKIDIENKKITVGISGKTRDLVECKGENVATPYQFPIQYAENFKIGKLPVGEYTIVFGIDSTAKTKFSIVKASLGSIDENLYAPIGQVFVPEIIGHKDDVHIIITGVLNNSCMRLEEKNIIVLKQRDVFVILPILSYEQRRDCLAITRPFQFIISLGKQEIGRYLLHTRSLSGQSINRLFTIKNTSQADSEVNF